MLWYSGTPSTPRQQLLSSEALGPWSALAGLPACGQAGGAPLAEDGTVWNGAVLGERCVASIEMENQQCQKISAQDIYNFLDFLTYKRYLMPICQAICIFCPFCVLKN